MRVPGGTEGLLAFEGGEDGLAGVLLGPDAGQSAGTRGGGGFATDRRGGGDHRLGIVVLIAVRARKVAWLSRGNAGVEVGPGLDAVLERIDAELGLLLLSHAVGLTQIASGCGIRLLVRTNQIQPHLKIGELVGGRKRGAGVALPLGLNNLGQRLVGHAALGVVAGNRLARHVAGAEHQAVAGVAVVRNSDHVESLLALGFEVAPEIFGIQRIERRVGHRRPFVGEDHAAVQVLELRRRGPLESDERRELARLVVLVGDGRVLLP